MEDGPKLRKINWYRSPVKRELLAALNQRSDGKGLLQALGHLGLLLLTGAGAWYAAWHASVQGLWLLFAVVLFLHGTLYAFLLNGFHELCHSSVFKSKWLNSFFLYLFSFLGGYNPVFFWASVTRSRYFLLSRNRRGSAGSSWAAISRFSPGSRNWSRRTRALTRICMPHLGHTDRFRSSSGR